MPPAHDVRVIKAERRCDCDSASGRDRPRRAIATIQARRIHRLARGIARFSRRSVARARHPLRVPWVVPSHQALVLPLKIWRPRWFSGLGLVLGSIAPDAVFILALDLEGSSASHSVRGQLYLTVPLVLIGHWLATAVVLPWLLPHCEPGPPMFLDALAGLRPARGLLEQARVAWSGAIGGLSHIALDGFTHARNDDGWAIEFLPWLQQPVRQPWGEVPVHDALQAWLTLCLGVFAVVLWQLAAVGRLRGSAEPRRVDPAPLAARRTVTALGILLFLEGGVAVPALRRTADVATTVQLAAYGGLAFITFGMIAAAAAAHLRRLRTHGSAFGLRRS